MTRKRKHDAHLEVIRAEMAAQVAEAAEAAKET